MFFETTIVSEARNQRFVMGSAISIHSLIILINLSIEEHSLLYLSITLFRKSFCKEDSVSVSQFVCCSTMFLIVLTLRFSLSHSCCMWCGIIRYNMMWCSAVWCGAVQCSMIWYGTVCCVHSVVLWACAVLCRVRCACIKNKKLISLESIRK